METGRLKKSFIVKVPSDPFESINVESFRLENYYLTKENDKIKIKKKIEKKENKTRWNMLER